MYSSARARGTAEGIIVYPFSESSRAHWGAEGEVRMVGVGESWSILNGIEEGAGEEQKRKKVQRPSRNR